MTARLIWLGLLADAAGKTESDLHLKGAIGWDDLLALLPPPLAEALQGPQIRVARNGTILTDRSALEIAPGDEIAFLPPVSGG